MSVALGAPADEWPTYMHDNARSGVTTSTLAFPLKPLWTYQAPAAPRPAWPPPQEDWTELPKMDFDDALYAVAADGSVYFGSSVDNQIHALDAATGRVRWSFFTGGPVRLAPTLAHGRVYAGSDDGRVYCLNAADGKPVWTHNGAPRPQRVLGSGRVISMWPVRTGVLVDGNTAYFASGIFPMYLVRVFALRADNGEPLWTFPGAEKRKDLPTFPGGFAPQGYLLATDTHLVAPCGRTMPAVLTRADGKLLGGVSYGVKSTDSGSVIPKGEAGGVYGVLLSGVLYVGTQNNLYGFNLATGTRAGKWASARHVTATPDTILVLRGPAAPQYGRLRPGTSAIRALDRRAYEALPKKDDAGLKACTRWQYARDGLEAMVVAGPAVVAGGAGEVVALDALTGKEVWTAPVNGRAVGLAVADGRLLVSTDRGCIHCFGDGAVSAEAALAAGAASSSWADAAGAVLKEFGATRGYALLTGPGAVGLAIALARRSELNIYVAEADAKAVSAAREQVAAAGLYGWRVTVDAIDAGILPLPDYVANLVVCSVPAGGGLPADASELLRVLKPCGGVLLAGAWAAGSAYALSEADRLLWTKEGRLTEDVRLGSEAAHWLKLVRGAPAGAGWWTHQFADAGGTGSSGDQRVKDQLDVIWYGEPGANKFPDRHRRGVAPLIVDGRVICEGFAFKEKKNILLSFDAYNGLPYWERELPGAQRLDMPASSGNQACTPTDLFVAAGSGCHRMDVLTGEQRTVYETPKAPDGRRPDWAYLAVSGRYLVGSAAAPANKPFFSEAVFAYDTTSGKMLWTYRSPEIRDSTIACGDGRVYFAENREQGPARAVPNPPAAGAKEPAEDDSGLGDAEAQAVDRLGQPEPSAKSKPCVRTVVSLDLATGQRVWERTVDLTDCGQWGAKSYGALHALCKEPYLVFGGAHTPYGRPKPDQNLRRVTVLSTKDGSVVWTRAVGNKSRPVIMGDWLLAEPSVYDLSTGEAATHASPKTGRAIKVGGVNRSGGCGSLSASASMVFYRSGITGWRDILSGSGGIFIGIRPGCFINIIPAGGMAVQVEASSGCACYHAMQCTVGFKPREPAPTAGAASAK